MFLQCNKNAIYVLNTSYRYGVSCFFTKLACSLEKGVVILPTHFNNEIDHNFSFHQHIFNIIIVTNNKGGVSNKVGTYNNHKLCANVFKLVLSY